MMALSGLENPAFILENEKHEDKETERTINVNSKEDTDGERTFEDCNCFGKSLSFLNKFRNPKWCLVFLSIGAIIQGLVINGFVNVVLTSIERRFGLQSTQSGLIASSYDISTLIVSIPISYFGGRIGASKPRWIAIGLFVMGTGSFVFSLPHFMTGNYIYREISNGTVSQEPLCNSQTETVDNTCLYDDGEISSSLSKYRYLFILGQLLHGIGANPLILLGTTLINESVSKEMAPIYISIFQTCFVIGPALGFILGGALLNVFVDSVPNLDITPESVVWVGAWWPGFLLAAGLAIVIAFPLFCFPANLNERIVEKIQEDEDIPLKIFVRQLKRLVTNPIYVLVCLGGSINNIVIFGTAAFLSKYMEQQYRITIGFASQLAGLMLVVAGGGGTFLGGWIIKKMEMKRTSIILMCCLCAITGLFSSFAFLFGCSAPVYTDINNVPVQFSSQLIDNQQCNRLCSCSVESFSPVCGSDNKMYLSPCLAGCQSQNGGNYSDCSCIENAGTASNTKCSSDCTFPYLVLFLIIMFVSLLANFMTYTPKTVVVLRSVRPEDEDMAIGLLQVASKLMGSIPGPIIFGFVFDQVCQLWEPDCGEIGSCLLYDHAKMSNSLFGIIIVIKIIYLLCLGGSAWFSHRDEDNSGSNVN